MTTVKTLIKHNMSGVEFSQITELLKTEDYKELLKYVNCHIAYKNNEMISCWAFANYYLLKGKVLPTEPKGTFIPNSLLFKSLCGADITISLRYSDQYVKEIRMQTVPLPL